MLASVPQSPAPVLGNERSERCREKNSRDVVERSLAINAKVFVGNLSFETTQYELEKLMSQAGQVESVYFPTDRTTGRPRGFAFVEYTTDEEAEEAIRKFNDAELGGRKLRVNAAEARPPRIPRPGPSFGDGFGSPGRGGKPGGRGGPGGKPKGSRRGMRGKKRSL